MRMLEVALVVVCFHVPFCSAQDASAEARAGVARFNHALDDATRRMDNAATLALWEDDGVSLLPQTLPIAGKRAITAFMDAVTAQIAGGKMEKFEMACSNIEIAGTSASEWCTEHQIVRLPDDKKFEGWGRMLLVLRRGPDGSWRMLREMWQPVAAPRRCGFRTMRDSPGAYASAQTPVASLLVSTDWLAKNLTYRSVVVLVVDRTDSAYRAGHVPGARYVPYSSIGQRINGINLELPAPDSLRNLFESAGVSTSTHVVLTGRPLIVTRAFYTLDYLGLTNVSALDGGFTKWKREGRAAETAAPQIERGHISPAPRPEIVAKAPWVRDRIGKPGYSFVDTRTDSEYIGIGARGGLRSTGHLEGARRLEWQTAFTDTTDFSPKSLEELGALWRERVVPGDTVIAYCYIGYRASGTYFISRLLGYPVKLYDGSYDEWAQLKYPTVTAVTPLRKP